jgi:hypothetical protein
MGSNGLQEIQMNLKAYKSMLAVAVLCTSVLPPMARMLAQRN